MRSMEDLAAHKEEERKKKARREQLEAEQIAQDDAEFAEISAGRNGWAMRNSHYARGLGATLKAPTSLQRTS